MMKHKFVEFIPELLEPNVLFISLEYDTAVHLCACGCGNEVVTPISPAEWSLTYDGRNVSLSPSIGNWSFPCRSHYWIRKGAVDWARQWSEKEIEAVKETDRQDRVELYAGPAVARAKADAAPKRKGVVSMIVQFVSSLFS